MNHLESLFRRNKAKLLCFCVLTWKYFIIIFFPLLCDIWIISFFLMLYGVVRERVYYKVKTIYQWIHFYLFLYDWSFLVQVRAVLRLLPSRVMLAPQHLLTWHRILGMRSQSGHIILQAGTKPQLKPQPSPRPKEQLVHRAWQVQRLKATCWAQALQRQHHNTQTKHLWWPLAKALPLPQVISANLHTLLMCLFLKIWAFVGSNYQHRNYGHLFIHKSITLHL